MKTLRNTFILLSIVALALIVAPVAMADDIQSGNITYTTTDFSGLPIAVSQFDPALGTLTSVTITLTGGNLASTSVYNPTVSTIDVTDLTENTKLTLTNSLIGVGTLKETLSLDYGAFNVNSLDTVYFGTPTPDSYSGTPVPESVASAYFGQFIGNGNVDFAVTSLSGYEVSGGGNNANINIINQDDATVTIDYGYSENPPGIPEPGTLTLFGTGLLGLAGMLRHKFAK
jgi:hypothetical protein